MTKNILELSTKRKNNFDFLRFIAALTVLISHAFPLSGDRSSEPFILISDGQWTLGGIAVSIFFVISGYFISQSFDLRKNIFVFIKSRFLRLFPGLITVILLSVFVLGIFFTTLPVKEYIFHPKTIKYLQGIFPFPIRYTLPGVFENNAHSPSINGSLWTISYEIVCYLIIGFLGLFRLLSKRFIILFIFLTIFYLNVFGSNYIPDSNINGIKLREFIGLFTYFSIGVLYYVYREKVILNKWLALLSLYMLFIGLTLGHFKELFILFGSYLVMYIGFNQKITLHNFAKYGDFSYGIYIYAFPVQQTIVYIFGGVMSPILNIILSIPITLILAFFSWHLIEKRFLRLKSVSIITRFYNRKLEV